MIELSLPRLAEGLALGTHEHVAIVGGGGKTTILHALGRQLSGARIVTTTTKMGHDQHRGLPLLLSPSDAEIAAIDGAVMVWRAMVATKAIGVEPEDCDRWFSLVDHVVIEADGSRRRPFKAPGALEPVVPATATMLIVMMGADALGRVIGDQCHRPLRVAALAGCQPYQRLTAERAAAVLLHERGFRAARPPGARMVVAVNNVGPDAADAVAELGEHIADGVAARDLAIEAVMIGAHESATTSIV